TQEKFELLISKLPIFHRHIAQSAVSIKAQENARLRNIAQVEEQDVISAFFSDVPSPFYSMMIRLLEQTGFDYKRYGFPKRQIVNNE
ncbi:MAG: hypothetical protein ABIH18_05485, partial [Candidatus Omnitrophota bacterium]